MMDNIKSDVMNQLIDSYMKQNNPSPYTDSYYPQYHVVDFVVFNVKATKAFQSITSHLKDNRMLENKYTRHYSYKLTRRRECINSYSTVIQLIFTYPRRQNKAAKGDESVYSFLQTSKISDRCRDDWASMITACRPYEYLSKAEFVKLLNTHSDGCFVSSEECNRFRAFADEWEGCGESVGAAGTADGSDDDDDMRISRRSFVTPHPGIGLKDGRYAYKSDPGEVVGTASAAAATSSGHGLDGKYAYRSDSGETTLAATSSDKSASARQKVHNYYLSTGFMQHSICGLHKWTTVAKDIHRSTNTLMYHKRVYDRRGIRSDNFMMTHNPGKDPSSTVAKQSSSHTTNKQTKKPPTKRSSSSSSSTSKVHSAPPAKKRKRTTTKRKTSTRDDVDGIARKKIKHEHHTDDDDESDSSSSDDSEEEEEDDEYIPPSPIVPPPPPDH